MNLFWGLVLGVLAYFVAHLVFNGPVSALIGVVVACAVAFGFDRYTNRRL